jgi:hypothetical protein
VDWAKADGVVTRLKKLLRKDADRLFSKRVRARGICEAAGFDDVTCNGNLQTMHLVSRRYLSVRFDEGNAAAGCGAHHVYLTAHPIAHERFCKLYLGAQRFAELKRRAEQAYGAPDYDAILERLRATA